MPFSEEWEEAYKNNTNISIWPWTDLVSMFYHYFPKSKTDYQTMNVLELGCGAGANIPFFDSIGVNYDSVEGSHVETEILQKKYRGEKICIKEGDFSKGIPFDKMYDLIFDRAALSHNETNDIRIIIQNAYDKLKRGGYYFGINWFSTKEIEFENKIDIKEVLDERSFKFCGKGTYAGLGSVHFTDKEELLELFSQFVPKEISLKSIETIFPYEDSSYQWNFVMKKEE